MEKWLPNSGEWLVIALVVVGLFASEFGTKLLTLFKKGRDAKSAKEKS